MSFKDVTDFLPCEVARACFERAYPLAVQACMPPAGAPFFDPDDGSPYAGPEDLQTMLTQQFEVEVCRVWACPTVRGTTSRVLSRWPHERAPVVVQQRRSWLDRLCKRAPCEQRLDVPRPAWAALLPSLRVASARGESAACP